MTYTTNIRLDDDLAEAVKAYARAHPLLPGVAAAASGGISIADAIRLLLIKGLKEEKP